jgi:hypothetical protein
MDHGGDVGITVALQTIHGKELGLVSRTYGVLDRVLPIGDPRFPMLRYIDPYGNTIFNGEQMYPLLEEINRLAEEVSSEEGKGLLAQIRELAIHCRDHPHEFLRFIGD